MNHYLSKCKKTSLLFLLLLGISSINQLDAQIKVDENNNVGVGIELTEESAKLQVETQSQGFLKPVMNSGQMEAIQNPALGLEVFNTSENTTFYYNGFAWVPLGQGSTVVTEGPGIDVTGSGTGTNPYVVSLEGVGDSGTEFGDVMTMVHCTENTTKPYADSREESKALVQFKLPDNNYSKILVEAVVYSHHHINIAANSEFIWRFKLDDVPVKTFSYNLNSHFGKDPDGIATTNTLSTVIMGKNGVSGEVSITLQMSNANQNIFGYIHSFRVYGVSDFEVTTIQGEDGEQGPIGPQGPTGPAGPAGPANNLSIGSVNTGAPGTNANASIIGTPPNQMLNLTIPAGADGMDGQGGVSTAGPGITITGDGTVAVPYVISSTTNGTVTNVTGLAPINVDQGSTSPIISLNNLGITNNFIASNAVSTSKITNGAITNEKLSNNSVSTDKIQDEAVTPSKISPGLEDQVLTTVDNGGSLQVSWEDVEPESDDWKLDGNTLTSQKSLGTNSNHELIIETNGNERMRVQTGAGFVGIGTSDPKAKLNVSWDEDPRIPTAMLQNRREEGSSWLAFEGENSKNAAHIFRNNTAYNQWGTKENSWNFYHTGINPISFFTADKNRLHIEGGGFVGIGTDQPKAKLNVRWEEDEKVPTAMLKNSNQGGSSWLAFEGVDSKSSAHIFRNNSNYVQWGTKENSWNFYHFGVNPISFLTADKNRLHIEGEGNVGINTDEPSEKLDVNGNIRNRGAYYDANNFEGTNGQILVSTVSGTEWQNLNLEGTGWIQGGNALTSEQTLGTTTNFDLPIITNNQEVFRLDTDGRMIPNFLLDTTSIVIGQNANSNPLTFQGGNSIIIGENAGRNTVSYLNTIIGNEALEDGGDFSFGNTMIGTGAGKYIETNFSSYIGFAAGKYLSGVNNIAIGYEAGTPFANSPQNLTNTVAIGYQTHVNQNNMARIGDTQITSIGGAVDWTVYSDGRFKDNVKESVPGLSFIEALRPVQYNFNTLELNKFWGADKEYLEKIKGSKELQTGFIAQEVEAAADKLGFTFSGVDRPESTKTGIYGLRYAEFVVPLVKAVQEQQEIINTQKEDLKKMNDLIYSLMDRIAKLESK